MKPLPKYILFDLDGTITDPAVGILNSIQYALAKFEIDITDPKELMPFIGPPLIQSFIEYYGFSEEKAKTAVDYYREYFSDKGIYENRPYEGIEDTLTELKKWGTVLESPPQNQQCSLSRFWSILNLVNTSIISLDPI